MKSSIFIVISLLLIQFLPAQNLIPNPSFEDVTSKINQSICTSKQDFANRVRHWYSPTNVTPDVYQLHENNDAFPIDFRLPQPVDGTCLAGILTNFSVNFCKTYKEYVAIRLKDTLSIHKPYYMEFWITSKESDLYDIGVFFDVAKTNVNQCSMLESVAQFTTQHTIQQEEWKKVSFVFQPREPYVNVTVGNFKKSKEAKRQYLYVDNFLLTEKIPEEIATSQPAAAVLVEDIFDPKNILFDNGKFDLLATSFVELNKLVDYLAKEKGARIHIEGHTDNSGNPTFNQQLSINRANTIRKYLIAQGISSDRITIIGYGPSRPIASNETAAGRSLNRRVAFSLTYK